ncbi:LemA family protein [Jatrophihabitans lederbergiae]|uniref:NUDIX hydrolase n=1 Tax=Jatrophihabitans lederbergiae TaxID=3075547 RepID=A0ABU2J857_9ACTN|nr:NUDIX hydrolase [Jatrophihabitans sp. DSM 44399]MDT0261167.1 NUDIX hydrolase [Jatrophihabitans sp. DSM 44399]
MFSAGWLVAAVFVAILLTSWVTFTLTRLDRLHARVDAAQAALDAQLVRRAAALLHLGEMQGSAIPRRAELVRAARAAMAASPTDRRVAENEVGHAIAGLAERREELPAEAVAELSEAAARVLIARRFFNDAVRDTRTLRARRMPRLLRLAGHRELPQFFDIDDTSLLVAEPAGSAEQGAPSPQDRWRAP